MMMHAQTDILFFRWVSLTEQKWVSFRERRITKYGKGYSIRIKGILRTVMEGTR